MNRLKKLRVKAGLSQRQVADKFGYTTPQFVSNWERGISHPPITALTILAKLYNVSREKIVDILLPAEIKKIKQKYGVNRETQSHR